MAMESEQLGASLLLDSTLSTDMEPMEFQVNPPQPDSGIIQHTIGASQRRCGSKEKNRKSFGSGWIHGRSREIKRSSFTSSLVVIGSGLVGSEEISDVVIGVAKVLSRVGEGSLDGWSDKSYPGF